VLTSYLIKKNRVLREGSILLTVMGLLGVLIILTAALIRIAGQDRMDVFRYSRRVRLRWMANGELDALIARLEAGVEFLKVRNYVIKTEQGEVRVFISRVDQEGRNYLLKATAKKGSMERTAQRGVEAFFPSDYAVTVETNWRVLSRYQPAVLAGRVYVNGSCALAVTESGPLDLVGNRFGIRPLWTVFRGFHPFSLDGVGVLRLFRARVYPFAVLRPYSKPDVPFILAGKKAAIYNQGSVSEISDLHSGRPFCFPAFSRMFAALLARSESQFRFLGGDRGTLKIKNILNPKLVAKDLIAVGDGSSCIFSYAPAARKIRQIYFRKVRRGQPLDSIRIDPVADADAIGFRFFNARMGRLYLPRGGSKVYIQLQKEAYSQLGRVDYGTLNRSYCSVDHPFARFYLDNFSEVPRYREGEHYFVDHVKKQILFKDADLIAKYYTFLADHGDGHKLGFTVPVSLRYKYVYVNGERVDNVKREGGTLFFSTPPPKNASIGFMVRAPRIFGLRQVPPAGVGIFVDRIVRALKIDLGALQHYPAKGLIVSDRPLYVTGVASYPITIVSSSDIYIDNINRASDDLKPVGIISGKAVWIHNVNMKTNINRMVFVYSRAERIYTTTTTRPTSTVNSAFAKGTGFIIGSVRLAGQLENGYAGYSASIRRQECHLFSNEPFFSVQYRHDPAFLDPRNLPPGVFPLIRLIWWIP